MTVERKSNLFPSLTYYSFFGFLDPSAFFSNMASELLQKKKKKDQFIVWDIGSKVAQRSYSLSNQQISHPYLWIHS